MKIHQRTEIKMKCDRCGTSIAKSRMFQHQSGSKCISKELKEKQEDEVEEIGDETDEVINVRTESNKKNRKEQKERKVNKKQKTEEEISRRKS